MFDGITVVWYIIDDVKHLPVNGTKNAILINNDSVWRKKSDDPFTITMGSFDGAESCELIGLYLLDKINERLKGNYGLYRDDGLCAIKGSAKVIEDTKKQLCTLFTEYGLKVTVEANTKIVNDLDLTLDLKQGTYSPYMKENKSLQYVHNSSNHPPQILRNIPTTD